LKIKRINNFLKRRGFFICFSFHGGAGYSRCFPAPLELYFIILLFIKLKIGGKREMKLELERHRIKIIPESGIDEAYLEEVFKFKRHGESLKVTRINEGMGLSEWSYLEINGK